ncbi:hypothetical protein B0H13DRAFT_1902807 [Mycena leptocephala]|nr:hypothetical protein B0H13DRAFT_1902807 [Mycena leptocephala]
MGWAGAVTGATAGAAGVATGAATRAAGAVTVAVWQKHRPRVQWSLVQGWQQWRRRGGHCIAGGIGAQALGRGAGAAAGRRDDNAPSVTLSSDMVRPSDAALACSISTVRKGSSSSWRHEWLRTCQRGEALEQHGVPAFVAAFFLPLSLAVLVRGLATAAGEELQGKGSRPARSPPPRRERRCAHSAGLVLRQPSPWAPGGVALPAEWVCGFARHRGGGNTTIVESLPVRVALIGQGGGTQCGCYG